MKFKILVLGISSFPAGFYLNEKSEKLINVSIKNDKFEHSDILNLDNKLFYEKYFKDIGNNNFDYSLNFVHIHQSPIASEKEINTELCRKLVYVFKKLGIKKNIFISTVNSYKNTKSEYGKTKYNCEEIYRSLENSLIIRPSTIIDIDYNNRDLVGGKKGKSFKNLNHIISNYFLFPIPGSGKYLQTICFGDDLARFINYAICNNKFSNKTINFFTGERITYNEFIDIYLKFKKKNKIKLYIPEKIISFTIIFITTLFKNFKISYRNIENLMNQKIEFDFSKEIQEVIRLKKYRDLDN